MKAMLRWVGFVGLAAASIAAQAAGDPPAAMTLVHQAEAQAAQQHKNVLVIFHASWCGWCHRLDGFLSDKTIAPIMDKSFVILHVDVLEDAKHKAQENPGGEALLESLNGKDQGIPYYAIFTPKDKLLINSRGPVKGKAGVTGNIGYPGAPEEIAYFMKMMGYGPSMSESDRSTIESWLKANAPKGE